MGNGNVRHRKLIEESQTKHLSQEGLTKLLNQRYNEEDPERFSAPTDLQSAASAWISNIAVAPRTKKDYQLAVNSFLAALPKTKFDELRPSDSSYLIRKLTEDRRSSATIASYLRMTQIFLYYCAEQGWAPVIKLKKPKEGRREARVYSIEKIERILDILRKNKRINLVRMVTLMRYTGMRAGEVWALPLRNINLEKERLYIQAVDVLDWKPKKNNEATLPIVPKLAAFLKKDLKGRKKEERFFLDKGNGEPAYAGVAQMSRAMRKTLIALGIYKEQKTLHGFRASVITTLIQDGVPVKVVQSIARHAELSTTLKYVSSEGEDWKAALEKL